MEEKTELLVPLTTEEDDTTLVEVEETPQLAIEDVVGPIAYSEALKEMLVVVGPYSLGQLVNVTNIVASAYALRELGSDALASAPLNNTFIFLSGAFRVPLNGTALIVSNAIGEEQPKRVGRILQHSLLLGCVLMLPTGILYFSADKIFRAMGVAPEVTKQSEAFFLGILASVPPFFLLTSLQQVLLGLKQSTVVAVSNGGYRITAAAIGVPLALSTALDIKGLGYGYSTAAWASFIALEGFCLLRHRHYKQYDFFRWSGLQTFFKTAKGLFHFGLPIGVQIVTEWGNLYAISAIIGNRGYTEEEQAAILPITLVNLLIFALSHAGSVVARHGFAKVDDLQTQDKLESARIVYQNTMKKVVVCFGMGATVAVIATVPMLATPESIARLIIGDVNDEKMQRAKQFMIASALGYVPDAMRNVLTALLRGRNDVWFAPLVNLATLSAGLTAGAVMVLPYEKGPEWLFIWRDLSIVASCVFLTARWMTRPRPTPQRTESNFLQDDEEEMKPLTKKGVGWSGYFSFWRSSEPVVTDERIEDVPDVTSRS